MSLARRFRQFMCLIVFGVSLGAAAHGACQPENATSAPAYPALTLSPSDRILVLAPHPDDEVLACAGVIQKAVAMKLPVKIAFFTYGDNNEWAFLIYRRHLVVGPGAVEGMGIIRYNEAMAAGRLLGLAPGQLVFLGYPDFGTLNIWYDHWNGRPAYVSMLTRAHAVPYKNALRPGAAYKGEEIVRDLKSIIQEFKPTKIFLSHPADHNGDHRAVYLFTTIALWELGPSFTPQVFPYLIHAAGWPLPRGFYPEKSMSAPASFSREATWQEVNLTSSEVRVKRAALQLHRSEYISAARYLDTFVRRNEIFGDFPIEDFAQPAAPALCSLRKAGTAVPEELLTEERAAFVGIEKQCVRLEDGELVFSISLSQPVTQGIGVSLFVFGFRKDTPFEKMPKIHARFGALKQALLDQNELLTNSGIKATRQPKTITVTVPLEALGSPERVLTSVDTYLGNVALDSTPWRILELPQRPVAKHVGP